MCIIIFEQKKKNIYNKNVRNNFPEDLRRQQNEKKNYTIFLFLFVCTYTKKCVFPRFITYTFGCYSYGEQVAHVKNKLQISYLDYFWGVCHKKVA